MNELKPDHIDPERLAALIDGRLSADERAALLAQVAKDEGAQALLADAAAVTRELEGETTIDVPVHSRARRSWFRPGWMALAAGIVAVVALQVVRNQGESGDAWTLETILSHDAGGLPATWEQGPWRTTRGVGATPGTRSVAVRAGARMVDLAVLLKANDSRAPAVARELIELARAGTASASAVARYDSLIAGLVAPGSDPTLAALSRRAGASAAASLGEGDVAFGAWLEAARLAALRRDVAFFEASVPSTESAPQQAAMARLRAMARRSSPDWTELERQTRSTLQAEGD